MPKVRILQLPKAKSGTNIQIGKGMDSNYKAMPYPYTLNQFGKEDTSINNTLKPVDVSNANIEAEKGESVMIPGKGGIPETYKVGGDRHSQGGTPLNLPEESFVFSDTNKMKIKDPEILKQFNMSSSKKGYTPAEIAKKYDISKWHGILANPDAEKLNKETAERMIANSNLKLGKLALVQESMKSFPTGIPKVAFPYMESMGIDPSQFLPKPQQEQQEQMPVQRDGGSIMNKLQVMKMGGNPSYKVKILSLPKAQNGKEVKKWTLPKDSLVAKDEQEALILYKDKANNGKVIYISQPDGSYKKVIGAKSKSKIDATYKQGVLDKTLEGINPDLAKGLDYTMQLLNSNPKLKHDIVLKAKEAVIRDKELAKKDKAYNISQSEYDDILKSSDDDFLNKFKELQTHAYYASSKLNKSFPTDKASEEWDRGTSKKYEDLIKDKYTPLDAKNSGIGQAFYIGLEEMKKLNPDEYKDTLDKIELNQLGTADEIGVKDNPRISKVDGRVGNTTIRQIVKPAENLDLDLSLEDVSPDNIPDEIKHLNPVRQDGVAPWWLQDTIKTAGAAGDFFRVKKYNPWQATPDTKFIDPTFYDPTRELAANAEQSNIGTNAIAAFSNPQAFNARYKQIQGNAANNAANILAKYNNMNVGMANNAEQANTNIYNQASQNKANLSTQLFDKYTIANQQFDNAKNMARQNLRQSYIDAVTNRAKSQALNSLYPNYQHDPSSGGFLNYIDNGDKLRPENSTSELDSKLAMIEKIKTAYPDWTPEEISKFISGTTPTYKDNDLDEKQRVFNSIYGQ